MADNQNLNPNVDPEKNESLNPSESNTEATNAEATAKLEASEATAELASTNDESTQELASAHADEKPTEKLILEEEITEKLVSVAEGAPAQAEADLSGFDTVAQTRYVENGDAQPIQFKAEPVTSGTAAIGNEPSQKRQKSRKGVYAGIAAALILIGVTGAGLTAVALDNGKSFDIGSTPSALTQKSQDNSDNSQNGRPDGRYFEMPEQGDGSQNQGDAPNGRYFDDDFGFFDDDDYEYYGPHGHGPGRGYEYEFDYDDYFDDRYGYDDDRFEFDLDERYGYDDDYYDQLYDRYGQRGEGGSGNGGYYFDDLRGRQNSPDNNGQDNGTDSQKGDTSKGGNSDQGIDQSQKGNTDSGNTDNNAEGNSGNDTDNSRSQRPTRPDSPRGSNNSTDNVS